MSSRKLVSIADTDRKVGLIWQCCVKNTIASCFLLEIISLQIGTNFYRLLNWPSSANSNYTDWSEQISIVFLYEHIANIIGSESCIKKYTIQLFSPVCAIYSYSSNFGYNKQHMQLVLYRLDQLISSTRLFGHKHIMWVARIRNLRLSTTN